MALVDTYDILGYFIQKDELERRRREEEAQQVDTWRASLEADMASAAQVTAARKEREAKQEIADLFPADAYDRPSARRSTVRGTAASVDKAYGWLGTALERLNEGVNRRRRDEYDFALGLGMGGYTEEPVLPEPEKKQGRWGKIKSYLPVDVPEARTLRRALDPGEYNDIGDIAAGAGRGLLAPLRPLAWPGEYVGQPLLAATLAGYTEAERKPILDEQGRPTGRFYREKPGFRDALQSLRETATRSPLESYKEGRTAWDERMANPSMDVAGRLLLSAAADPLTYVGPGLAKALLPKSGLLANLVSTPRASAVGYMGGSYGGAKGAELLGFDERTQQYAGMGGGLAGAVFGPATARRAGSAAATAGRTLAGNIEAGGGLRSVLSEEVGAIDFRPGQRVKDAEGTWVVSSQAHKDPNKVNVYQADPPEGARELSRVKLKSQLTSTEPEPGIREATAKLGWSSRDRQRKIILANKVRSGKATPDEIAQYNTSLGYAREELSLRDMAGDLPLTEAQRRTVLDLESRVVAGTASAEDVAQHGKLVEAAREVWRTSNLGETPEEALTRAKPLGRAIDMTIKNPQPTEPLPGFGDEVLIGGKEFEGPHQAGFFGNTLDGPRTPGGRPEMGTPDEVLARWEAESAAREAALKRPDLQLTMLAEGKTPPPALPPSPPGGGGTRGGFGKMGEPQDWRQAARALGIDVLSLPRTMQSSFDVSTAGRQSWVSGISHPKAYARSLNAQRKAIMSHEGALEAERQLQNLPNSPVHKIAKLFLPNVDDPNLPLNEREESYMSNLLGRVPVVGPALHASQRAAVIQLKYQRTGHFDAVWDNLDPSLRTVENAEKLGRVVNHATGRGDLPGFLNKIAPELNQGFFSPRYIASRVQLITDVATVSGPIRREAIKQLVNFVAANTALLMAGKGLGIWDVETDPRSSDFGKGKVGNVRFDFWAGEQQIARFIAQEIAGQRKTSTGEIQHAPRVGTLQSFTRSKLSPLAGEAVTQLKGEDVLGRDAGGPLDAAQRLFSPLALKEFADATDEFGWRQGALALIGVTGIGVSAYEDYGDFQNRLARERHGKNWLDISDQQREDIKASPEFQERYPTEPVSQDIALKGGKANLAAARKKLDSDFASGLAAHTDPATGQLQYGAELREAVQDFKTARGQAAAGAYGAVEDFERKRSDRDAWGDEYWGVEYVYNPETYSVDNFDQVKAERERILAEAVKAGIDPEYITGTGTDKYRGRRFEDESVRSLVLEYETDVAAIERSGYWELPDQAAAYFAGKLGLQGVTTRRQLEERVWRDARASKAVQAADPEVRPALTERMANQMLAKYNEILSDGRKRWMARPEAQDTNKLLGKWGYVTERRLLETSID